MKIENTPDSSEVYEFKQFSNNYGTNEKVIPNRVFVGGIPANATELEVKLKLSSYGTVKAVKIIRDNNGEPKGYGFVTFNQEEEAKKALEKNEIILKGKRLHVAPAIKRQIYNLETSTDYSSETPSVEKYSTPSRSCEYQNSRILDFNQNDYISGNEELSPFSDISNLYIKSGQYYSATDMFMPYGNPQVNLFSYPTLVYVPQQAFQYSGGAAPIYLGTSVPEILQLIPLTMCCANGQQ